MSKQTVDRFLSKMAHHDHDSLNTIFSTAFLDEVDTAGFFHMLDSINSALGNVERAKVFGFEHKINNSKHKVILDYQVQYERKAIVQKFILVPENNTMLIFFWEINP